MLLSSERGSVWAVGQVRREAASVGPIRAEWLRIPVRMLDMVEPLIRTKRAARLSLAISAAALLAFALLLATTDEWGRLWAWGALLAAIVATFSVITAVRAPK